MSERDHRDDLLISGSGPEDDGDHRRSAWWLRAGGIAGAAAIAVVRFGFAHASGHHTSAGQSFEHPHGALGHDYATTGFGQRGFMPMEDSGTETPTPKGTVTPTTTTTPKKATETPTPKPTTTVTPKATKTATPKATKTATPKPTVTHPASSGSSSTTSPKSPGSAGSAKHGKHQANQNTPTSKTAGSTKSPKHGHHHALDSAVTDHASRIAGSLRGGLTANDVRDLTRQDLLRAARAAGLNPAGLF